MATRLFRKVIASLFVHSFRAMNEFETNTEDEYKPRRMCYRKYYTQYLHCTALMLLAR